VDLSAPKSIVLEALFPMTAMERMRSLLTRSRPMIVVIESLTPWLAEMTATGINLTALKETRAVVLVCVSCLDFLGGVVDVPVGLDGLVGGIVTANGCDGSRGAAESVAVNATVASKLSATRLCWEAKVLCMRRGSKRNGEKVPLLTNRVARSNMRRTRCYHALLCSHCCTRLLHALHSSTSQIFSWCVQHSVCDIRHMIRHGVGGICVRNAEVESEGRIVDRLEGWYRGGGEGDDTSVYLVLGKVPTIGLDVRSHPKRLTSRVY
jgi:hypothetical protein